MSDIEWVDRPPDGWFVLDVMKLKKLRKWDWWALMIEVAPDEHKHCRRAREVYVRIPGKHRTYEDAWEAMEEMISTRH